MSESSSAREDDWHRLDPRYPAMARQVAWTKLAVWSVLSALIGYGIWWLTPQDSTSTTTLVAIWVAGVLVNGGLWFRLPVLRYRHSSWRLDGDSLELRRGAWWFTETRVPRSRIQHTDVGQGPIERHHGLGHLVVYTAGTHHGQIRLRGIAHEVAISIRNELLQSGPDVSV